MYNFSSCAEINILSLKHKFISLHCRVSKLFRYARNVHIVTTQDTPNIKDLFKLKVLTNSGKQTIACNGHRTLGQ